MARSETGRYIWLDIIRGLAVLWVFLVHFFERFGQGSMFANPWADWPPLGARIAQLAPLDVGGWPGIFINGLRYVSWLGDQGVQVFLVASGFGLTMAAGRQTGPFSIKTFYSRRFFRLFPLWFVAHMAFILTFWLVQFGLPPADWRTWASLLGLRFLFDVMYFAFPAWWYIGLLLQLVILFPLLYALLRRWSPARFFLVVGGAAVLARLAGLLVFDQYLDWWSRGAVFPARLPEFAFGMAFAKWLAAAPPESIAALRRPASLAALIGIYLTGNVCSFFLVGMSVAFLLTGAGFFLLAFVLLAGKNRRENNALALAGRRSFGLYLFHHPVIIYLVPTGLAFDATGKIVFCLITALLASIGMALVLETVTARIIAAMPRKA